MTTRKRKIQRSLGWLGRGGAVAIVIALWLTNILSASAEQAGYRSLNAKLLAHEVVMVPDGCFNMGSAGRHVRKCLASFEIGIHEVTNAQYRQFDPSHRSEIGNDDDNQPVSNVSWIDAKEYTAWLSAQTGMQYGLPTDTQWEYAARAGSEMVYWWGDEIEFGRANCAKCGTPWDGLGCAPVGSFNANAFGLYDTAGNVWEWTEDCWEGNCDRHVIRGGSWQHAELYLGSAVRYWSLEDARRADIGFRIVRSAF